MTKKLMTFAVALVFMTASATVLWADQEETKKPKRERARQMQKDEKKEQQREVRSDKDKKRRQEEKPQKDTGDEKQLRRQEQRRQQMRRDQVSPDKERPMTGPRQMARSRRAGDERGQWQRDPKQDRQRQQRADRPGERMRRGRQAKMGQGQRFRAQRGRRWQRDFGVKSPQFQMQRRQRFMRQGPGQRQAFRGQGMRQLNFCPMCGCQLNPMHGRQGMQGQMRSGQQRQQSQRFFRDGDQESGPRARRQGYGRQDEEKYRDQRKDRPDRPRRGMR